MSILLHNSWKYLFSVDCHYFFMNTMILFKSFGLFIFKRITINVYKNQVVIMVFILIVNNSTSKTTLVIIINILIIIKIYGKVHRYT